MKKTLRVAVTGAAGQIGYALLFRLANGDAFGKETHIELRLIELERSLSALEGVKMELNDCAFSLLKDVAVTADLKEGFTGVDRVILVGSVPRKEGMERKDLLHINGNIFVGQGKAIAENASEDVKILVVGNPCNTNCLIAMRNAENIPADRWFAMSSLDENRSRYQLAQKAGVPVSSVINTVIWGNHSNTQFPDYLNAKIDGKPANVVLDETWLKTEFIETIRERGAEVIKARGLSSAGSAANAIINAFQRIENPTPEGNFFSMAISSDGSYGVPEGLVCSLPLRNNGGKIEIVQGLKFDDFGRQKLAETIAELAEEREMVGDLL